MAPVNSTVKLAPLNGTLHTDRCRHLLQNDSPSVIDNNEQLRNTIIIKQTTNAEDTALNDHYKTRADWCTPNQAQGLIHAWHLVAPP